MIMNLFMSTKKKLELGYLQLIRRVSQFKKAQTKTNFTYMIEGINNFKKLLKILGFEEQDIFKYLEEFESEFKGNYKEFENKKRKKVIDQFAEDKMVWIRDSIEKI